jgi:hypothetical protein
VKEIRISSPKLVTSETKRRWYHVINANFASGVWTPPYSLSLGV